MRKKLQGFSLVELFTVMSILGILVLLLIPNLVAARAKADDAAAKTYLREVTQGVEIKRYGSSFTLPPVQACTSLTDKLTSPNSVTDCIYQPGRRDAYNVTVTSKTGTILFMTVTRSTSVIDQLSALNYELSQICNLKLPVS